MGIWIDVAQADRALPVFGLHPVERLRRGIKQWLPPDDPVILSGRTQTAAWPGARLDDSSEPLGMRLRQALQQHGTLVVLDGNTVIDPRLIRYLHGADRVLVAQRGEGAACVAALRLTRESAAFIAADAASLAQVAAQLLAAGHAALLDDATFPAYIDKLRRTVAYWLFAVNDAKSRYTVERRLFLDNYKGSTDLLTAYVYPPLVWQAVRLCTRCRIHPNAVTLFSILLTAAAVPLFATAHWLAGFLCAYAMSVLDSVDGKLARLTLTDSKLGDVLDHGLDLVHPPFWYWAWGHGLLLDGAHPSVTDWALWLNVCYVLDRLVLGVARFRLKHALHSSTRLDERVRSIIARRNINMTLVAVAVALGIGPVGLIAVALWQGMTVLWHAWRTLWLGWLSPLQDRQRITRTS
jgi:phosphatidylglycerophosphate synthase